MMPMMSPYMPMGLPASLPAMPNVTVVVDVPPLRH